MVDVADAREKMIARRFGGAQNCRTGGKGTIRRKKKRHCIRRQALMIKN